MSISMYVVRVYNGSDDPRSSYPYSCYLSESLNLVQFTSPNVIFRMRDFKLFISTSV